MTELCRLIVRHKSGIWPFLGLKLAILAAFFKDIDFKFVLPSIYKSGVWPILGLKLAILAAF